MLDFLFSPFKALYSLDTYIKATKQEVWKTILFLFYLLILFSFLFCGGIIVRTAPLTPLLQEITRQVALITPEIQIKDGKLSANNGEYYEIEPTGLDKKIVFDTARTEPVYPTQLLQQNIAILVTDKTMYIAKENQVQSYDFNFDKNQNFTLNTQYILDNQTTIISFIKRFLFFAVLFAMPIAIGFFMFLLMVLAIIATAISQLFAKTQITFGNVCSICCYLLAPGLFFFLLVLLLPFDIPLVWFFCFAIFMVYAQFILNKIKFNQNKIDEE